MAEKNNIDKLFADKLGAGEAAGYSEAAWSGASAMLDRHYRLLFWKRAAMISVPLLVVAGLTWWAVPNQEATDIAAPIVSPASTIEQDISQESETATYSTEEASSSETSPVGSGEASSITNDATSSVSSVESASSKEIASISEGPEMGSTSASTPSSYVDETPERSIHQISQIDPSFNAPYENVYTRSSAVETISASEVDFSLDLMPTFNINGIGAGNAQGILGRDKLKKDKPAVEHPRLDVQIHGGLVIANGISVSPNFESQGSNQGYYSGVSASYKLHRKFRVGTGVFLNNRSLKARFMIWNDEGLWTPTSLTYLDIPVQVLYSIGARHEIGFGMTYSPFLHCRDAETLPAFDAEPGRSSPEGSAPGFANFDVAGLFQYRLQISRRFFVNAQFRYGLFDVTDDEFYMTGDRDDRNHQIRIGLSYRIINR